ncbi:MAG: hypothetical protein DMD98_17145 [Candidatus Rokuibacteriota bacterium]|nr:MAG: hypothetical protein DMD98_17145 [Candidatus Rokubacteria bacterium]
MNPKNHWTNSKPPTSSTSALSSCGKTIRERCDWRYSRRVPFSIASSVIRSRKIWLTGSTSLSAENEARTMSRPRRLDHDQLRAGFVQEEAM